jgi:hypothetical protein
MFTEEEPPKNLAAHNFNLSAIQVWLWFAFISPVEHFVLLQLPDPERDSDIGMSI